MNYYLDNWSDSCTIMRGAESSRNPALDEMTGAENRNIHMILNMLLHFSNRLMREYAWNSYHGPWQLAVDSWYLVMWSDQWPMDLWQLGSWVPNGA